MTYTLNNSELSNRPMDGPKLNNVGEAQQYKRALDIGEH